MAVESHDKTLEDLLKWVETGKAQLPDFQRSWVWDDTKICKLIESITSGFPMGAAMFLAYGGEEVRFKYRKFEGVTSTEEVTPDWLVLDGQQRLTTLYQVLKSKGATKTRREKNREVEVERYYYLDIKKCLDPNEDRLDAIISMPDTKKLTADIGRTTILDLSTRENEYENLMFPLNISFSPKDTEVWRHEMIKHHGNSFEISEIWFEFYQNILRAILDYKMPVIQLEKETSKEAVCQIFENVNTGGVPLTVFELVTASFAADAYKYPEWTSEGLRQDWHDVKKFFAKKTNGELLSDITGANFLAAMTLLVTYHRRVNSNEAEKPAVTCKKRDILKLDLSEYLAHRRALVQGFCEAADFLVHQGIYRSRDLPYTTQLIPLAAIFAYDRESTKRLLMLGSNKEKLARWYWCGVFGELYGGANEARFALDIIGIFQWMEGGDIPDTVYRSSFQPTRLLTLQTRNSAAYKGIMALIMQDSPLDFMNGNHMDIASYIDEDADIHHIFPYAYCENQGLPKKKFNSVVNKTPIYASSNRSIGGHAPSIYIGTMSNKGLDEAKIIEAIESHKINYEFLAADDFDAYFIDRAKRLLKAIETATGKTITGLDSDDTIREFGQSLM